MNWLRGDFLHVAFFIIFAPSMGLTQSPPYVNLRLESGEVPRLSIAETHVAELKKKELPPKSIPIVVDIVNDDCSFQRPESFTYNLGLKIHTFTWEWTKHPDSTRLHQPARVNFGEFNQNLVAYGLLSNHTYQTLDAQVPPDTIDMNVDFSQIHVLHWSNQLQVFNPETGTSEEQLITFLTDLYLRRQPDAIFNVDLKPKQEQTNELSNIPKPPYPFGSHSIWLLGLGDEMCEFKLKPEMSSRFWQNFSDYLVEAPSVYRPYVLDSDSWSQLL